MAKQKQNDQPPKAITRRRDAQYPYCSLNLALRLGQAVADHGGDRSDVPKSVVAQHLGVGDGTSAFFQVVASAKVFGIVDGVRSLRLTERGREYFSPTSEGGLRRAMLDFLQTPPAYRFLIDRFDGNRLPNAGIIANLLMKECDVPKSWGMRSATMFITSMSEGEVVDATGHLRYDATYHGVLGKFGANHWQEPAASESAGASAQTTGLRIPVSQAAQPQSPVSAIQPERRQDHRTWTYEDGSAVLRVETPSELTVEQWELLNAYVNARKPKTGDGGPK